MAIHRFSMLYKQFVKELGADRANALFPEYATLPDKLPPAEQVKLASVLMQRMDDALDRGTIIKMRQAHSCNPSKRQLAVIDEIREQSQDLDAFCAAYSNALNPGYVKKEGDLLTVSFGWGKCVCGLFRKLENYEPVSQTWCECCNGHVRKTFRHICGGEVSSEILETVVCGGTDCLFRIRI